jgi:hypothetical protein
VTNFTQFNFFFTCRHEPVTAAPAAGKIPQQQAAGRPVEHQDEHGGTAAGPLNGTAGSSVAGSGHTMYKQICSKVQTTLDIRDRKKLQ